VKLAESINPPSITQAVAAGRLAEANSPGPGATNRINTPDPSGIGRNMFFICGHPLVPTVDSLRQFYRQSIPQFRTNLFNS
jgi:hypothetical protein